jgi:hypothetical protein
MEAKYMAGDMDLKPNTFTYNVRKNRANFVTTYLTSLLVESLQLTTPSSHCFYGLISQAVINALAKSGETGAAARAERVLQNMVNRHRNGGSDDVKPTTINFNTGKFVCLFVFTRTIKTA